MKIEIEMLNAFRKKCDPRREQERADARMISEDHSAMANLSPRFINKEFNPDRFTDAFKLGDE